MADAKDIEKTSYRKKPPLPVDRGWAWCVMIGIYVIMLILVAFGRSLSIFLPDILDRYKEPAAVTTLAFGMSDICWSVTNIVMPVLLLPRFNVRTLVLTGAFCQCFGVIALAYAPNIIFFNCLFGVLGMAAALMIGPSMIHLGQYFKKRLSFASSVTHVGGSTSTVLVPRLAQFLKEMYGYQGAMLILGGVSFHCVAAAMLLWPVSMFDDTDHTKEVQDKSSENDIQPLLDINGVQMEFNIRPHEQDKKEEIDDASNNKVINEESKFLQVQDLNNVQIKQLNSTVDLKTTKGDINRQLQFERNDDAKTAQLIPLTGGRFSRATSQRIHDEIHKLSSRLPDLELDSQVKRKSENSIDNEEQFTSCYNDNIEPDSSDVLLEPPENSVNLNLSEEEQHKSTIQENISNQTALTQDESKHEKHSTTPAVASSGCCGLQKIKAYLSSSVLLNPVAVMLIMAGGLSTPGGNMYLPVLGLENGLSPDEVSWMLTIMGIADIFGKLGIGFFADLGYVRPIRIACMSQLIVGLVSQFTVFYRGFGSMIGMAIAFGIMNGVVQSLMSPMVIELLGLQYLAHVTSAFYLCMGLFTFVLNVSVGSIKDATGSFFGGFNFLGGMMLTTFAILLLEPLFVRCSRKSCKRADKVT